MLAKSASYLGAEGGLSLAKLRESRAQRFEDDLNKKTNQRVAIDADSLIEFCDLRYVEE